MATAYEEFEKQYIARTKKSKEMYEDARQHLAEGVAGAGGYRRPYPLYVREARGSRIWDVDGNEYIDAMVSGGCAILGHSPAPIVEAVSQQLVRGTNAVLTFEQTIELAKKIKQHMPGMELVRFVNSGSEAVHMALRAARVYTGREKYAKAEGNFIGQLDNELVSLVTVGGPENSPESVAGSPGIPKSVLNDVLILPYNDAEASVALIKKHANELASVVIEPVNAWIGAIPTEKSYIEALRKVCDEEGILLIYDEVMMGFRLGLSGACSLFEVLPDLRTLGKIIGGGFPVGAFGGRKDIMNAVFEEKRMIQSGTFSGNPITMTAGLACLKELEKPGFYERINGLGERLRSGLRKKAVDVGLDDMQVTGLRSCLSVHFNNTPVKNVRDVGRSDTQASAAFSSGWVANGIYIPGGHTVETAFICAAHTDADIDTILDVSEEVLRVIKKHRA